MPGDRKSLAFSRAVLRLTLIFPILGMVVLCQFMRSQPPFLTPTRGLVPFLRGKLSHCLAALLPCEDAFRPDLLLQDWQTPRKALWTHFVEQNHPSIHLIRAQHGRAIENG